MSSKEGLSCLKNHLVVYFKEFINEEPGSIGAQLTPIPILEHPVTFHELYAALLPRQRVVVKLDIAISHPPYPDDSRCL